MDAEEVWIGAMFPRRSVTMRFRGEALMTMRGHSVLKNRGQERRGTANFDVRREFPLISFCLLSQVGN